MSTVREWEYIPREAFLYMPEEQDMKEGSGKTMLRRIFESGLPYDEYEQQRLRELNQLLEKKGVTMISWFTQANKLRFLHAKKFDIQDTRKTIAEHCKWRSSTIPIKVTPDLQSFLNNGAVYFSGRDYCFRPVLVIDVSKFDLDNPETQKVEFLSRVLGVLFEFMIDELLVEGQVENYVMVVNLNNLGVWSVGGLVKNIMSFTTNTYRSRLFAAYIVNSPGMITMFWNGVKGMLSENTVKKINFHGKNVPEPLFNHCGKDVIEEKFGGNRPNLTEGFWPPVQMTRKAFKMEPEHSKKLISPREYHDMFKDGRLKNRKVSKQLLEEVKETVKPNLPAVSVHQPATLLEEPFIGRSSNTIQSVEDARTANFQGEPVSEMKKGFSFMDEPLRQNSRVPNKPSHLQPQQQSYVLTSTVGGSYVGLPLQSTDLPHSSVRTGNEGRLLQPLPSDLHPHSTLVTHVTRTTLSQSIIRDLDLPTDHESHVNQVRVIRTFFESSHYKNMKKNYYDFI